MTTKTDAARECWDEFIALLSEENGAPVVNFIGSQEKYRDKLLPLIRKHFPPSVPVSQEIINFLRGAGPLDGKWFGDKDKKGSPLWWRKFLPPITEARSHE